MGEVNGSLRALLIQSRASLPAMAGEMASKGMISPETLARLQETYRQRNGGSNGHAQSKVRVI